MIIQITDKRRLRSYRYGWVIEALNVRKHEDGSTSDVWAEDRPAYPPSLSRAFEVCLERHLKETGDCDVDDVPQRIRTALSALRSGMEAARRAA